MKTTRQFFLILRALTLSVSGFALSAEAKVRLCTTEECACEQALEKNSVEALEAFLKKYPQSVNNKDSACGALAVPPEDGLDRVSPDGNGAIVEPDVGAVEG
jgi:hypothetical protein